MKANIPIALAADVLGDSKYRTWTIQAHYQYLSDALRVLASLKPGYFAALHKWQLDANKVEQTIPTGYYLMLRDPYNMGAAGTAYGRTMTQTKTEALTDIDPSWRAVAPAAAVKHYVYDAERAPKRFECYPPPNAALWVQGELAADPTGIADQNDTLSCHDTAVPALVEWMLYRAYSRDDEKTFAPQKAAAHVALFFQLLGIKIKTDMLAATKVRRALEE